MTLKIMFFVFILCFLGAYTSMAEADKQAGYKCIQYNNYDETKCAMHGDIIVPSFMMAGFTTVILYLPVALLLLSWRNL